MVRGPGHYRITLWTLLLSASLFVSGCKLQLQGETGDETTLLPAPSLSVIEAATGDVLLGQVDLTVTDAPASFSCSEDVTVTSADQNVIPDNSILVTGTGTDCTIDYERGFAPNGSTDLSISRILVDNKSPYFIESFNFRCLYLIILSFSYNSASHPFSKILT